MAGYGHHSLGLARLLVYTYRRTTQPLWETLSVFRVIFVVKTTSKICMCIMVYVEMLSSCDFFRGLHTKVFAHIRLLGGIYRPSIDSERRLPPRIFPSRAIQPMFEPIARFAKYARTKSSLLLATVRVRLMFPDDPRVSSPISNPRQFLQALFT